MIETDALSALDGAIVKMRFIEGADTSLSLPTYETRGAAGADVRANFPIDKRDGILIPPLGRALVPAGFSIEIPEGFEVQVRPRSGLALKFGVTVLNSPGTIDSDYRGPVGIILVNLGNEDFQVLHGDRIAQIVVAPVVHAEFIKVEALSETIRGEGGFGSTGKRDT